MILWRVSNYASLDGSGGLYVSGRWHTKGHAIVYCAQNPATALLETLVHIEIDAEDRPERFQVLKIEGPETLSSERMEPASLPADWPSNIAETQSVGDRWLAKQRTLLLEVPSVLVPETWNVLVNPQHPEANLLRIAAIYGHAFDARLFN
ncbi:MAG TPA: RES family NAD+ phosphorylase [Terracidiphilus sp.]|nr:RES family NAD+ phosphorylase [Terracidiphilus sp.]